jgi:predicted DNA-binding transcriptional regulator AlpA
MPEHPQTHLTEADTARYLGFRPSALRHWRHTGAGPPYLRIGRAIRYRVADLDEWLDAHRVLPWGSAAPRRRP